ncbi:MAG: PHP domain-containing protein, partial [Thermoplasmata archaeon]
MENYVDFHIHSTFSDGKYSIGEITNFARKHNFRSIGITDHYKTTKVKSMDNKMLEKYIETIDSINSDIKIYKGIEIDFSSRTDFSML